MFFSIKIIPHRVLVGVIVSVFLLTAGCATPVGVSRVNEGIVYQQIDSSALISNSYSSATSVVLHRHGLQETNFTEDPEAFIRNLHGIAANDDRRDLLLSLSELCFLTAKTAEADQMQQMFDNPEFYYDPVETDDIFQSHDPVDPKTYYLGSSVYAYLFLLGEGAAARDRFYSGRAVSY